MARERKFKKTINTTKNVVLTIMAIASVWQLIVAYDMLSTVDWKCAVGAMFSTVFLVLFGLVNYTEVFNE